VVRRHPDIKLLRREQDIALLADKQLAILLGLWPLLKPGGRLLYVTCSVLEEENCLVVQRFLDQCPAANPIPLAIDQGETSGHGCQLLPSATGPDGLYFALLGKRP
jgi:16S rRNA (cytosine967-C5)-methyltransferase